MLLDWFLKHSQSIDIFFMAFGIIIETLICFALYAIYKARKKK